jgi:hypothetical protein
MQTRILCGVAVKWIVSGILTLSSLTLAFEWIRSYWRVDHVGVVNEIMPSEQYCFWDLQFRQGGVRLSLEDVSILNASKAQTWLKSYRERRGWSFDLGVDPSLVRNIYPTASGDPSDVPEFVPISRWLFAFGVDWESKTYTTSNGAARPIRRTLVLPAWLLLLTTASWPLLLTIKYWRKSRTHRARGRKGYCLACGYDLRGSKDRCPECGREIDKTP